MSGFGLALHPEHAAALQASGITPDHARSRGYVTVDTKKRLDDLGVTKAGQKVPGLLVPLLRADGSTWGYQYRPDKPRERNGRPVKYETPAGQRNGIDVPPGVGGMLDDPGIPLWITEGSKKADAGALAALCIVALPGVWSWLGTNPKGGKVALPEWRDIALNDRRVVLAFDGDVARKRSVRSALDALAGYLSSKGALVEYLHLPDEGDRVGLDDFLVAGHDVDDLHSLVRPEPPALAAESAPVAPPAPVAPVTGEGGVGTGAASVEKVTGAVLDEVRTWLARFVCVLDEADLDLLTLWAVHTHVVVETYTTPRLQLDSPVPGSGKTTVLEHLVRLCHDPVQMASLASPALLTRMLDERLRTVLIDEADRTLSPDKEGVGELIAVLNSGYKRGGTRPVLVPTKENGWRTQQMSTFAPVAFAGNDPKIPDDTKSRTLRVLLMPDTFGVAEDSDWEMYDDEARELGRRVALWAEGVKDQIRTNRPELPEGIRGRSRERWAPLKRVAVAAGGRWPSVVDAMAKREAEELEAEREDGIVQQKPSVALLGHIHEVWGEDETFIATEELIERLTWRHPETWGPESPRGKALTPQALGRMLSRSYKITSDRLERTSPRGYLRSTLAPAFHRFGLDPSHKPARPARPAQPAEPAQVPSIDEFFAAKAAAGGGDDR